MGGTYEDAPGGKPLKRWFQEEWKDVGDKSYPVYRPTKRVSSATPLTPNEIDPKNLQAQIRRKQQIRGEKNLEPFQAKGGVANIHAISNPDVVFRKFQKYKGKDDATIALSDKPDKKYVVRVGNRSIHFGSTLPDFTRHGNEARRQRYLQRARGIEGRWRDDKYSANNLAINLLW